jgi:hypothetical protein
MEHPAASAPTDTLAALRARIAALGPGEPPQFDDLRAGDPFGPGAFDALAGRFGFVPTDAGGWRLAKEPRWTPGWIGPELESDCLDLFESAFGYRMDARLWRWKYRDANPWGMGVWQGDRLVAFYGGMPREILVRGRAASAVQIGDVMVEPSQRGVMTRSGPFQIAASTFLERRIGAGRSHLLGFGFPTVKALQVAQRLGLYAEVDQVTQLTWPAGAPWTGRVGLRVSALANADVAAIDRLWLAMARDFPDSIIGVRDWRQVESRYLRHPTVDYRCLLVTRPWGGAARAAIVMRTLDDRQAELVDIIGPRESFGAAIAAARQWAADHKCTGVRAWVTASHAHMLELQSPQSAPLGLVVPSNIWSPGPAPDEVRGRWWLMAGDTDFR